MQRVPQSTDAPKQRMSRDIDASGQRMSQSADVSGQRMSQSADVSERMSQSTDAPEGASQSRSPQSRSPQRRSRRWPFVLFGIIVALLLVAAGSFSFWRWGFCDDAADLQGTWYVVSSEDSVFATQASAPIEITSHEIVLSDDVSYTYTMDTGAKTLSISLANLSGQARYRFSLDRQTLAIQDGAATWDETLIDDIAWSCDALFAQIRGTSVSPAFSGSDTIVLSRTP